MIRDRVKGIAEGIYPKVVDIRRHLHRYPELSFQEVETGKYIQHVLEEQQIPFTTGWAGNGVVAIVEGNKPDSKVVALRADIDALPIHEDNDTEYSSKHPGIMHACGHDVHTASLLATAKILNELRHQFDGTVKFIFQPGEEKMPGGASIMIKEGVLEDPKPSSILGQHVYSLLPVGTVGFRSGKSMASSDEIRMKVNGVGGHGAVPQFAVDPIVITSQIITALQQLVSRQSDPTIPSVLTFGKIQSEGGAFNVIPNSVSVEGTFRTFNEYWRYQAHDKMKKIAGGIAASFDASCDLDITVGYPFLVNEEALTERCRSAAIEFLGADHVREIPARLTSEDFAYYTHHMHGCFYRLGIANPDKNIVSPVHSSTFDIDENALITGPSLMAWLAITELSN